MGSHLFSYSFWLKGIWSKKLLLWLVFVPLVIVHIYQAGSVAGASDYLVYLKLDESDGEPYVDIAGNHNAMCNGNCPISSDGVVNGSQFFDGNNTGIDIPAHANFDWNVGDNFAVEFWVKAVPGETCAVADEVIVGQAGNGAAQWSVSCSSPGGQVHFELSDDQHTTVTLQSTKVITTGMWHHVVAIRDGSNDLNSLYVDGSHVVTATASYSGNFAMMAPINLGHFDAGFHFQGSLDEVALYSQAVTAATVQTHYYLARGYTLAETCHTPVRIMPLGDSITRGSGPSGPHTGYRQPLYLSLQAADYHIDFVGSLRHPDQPVLPDFDKDHEGRSGWQAKGGTGGGLAPNIYNWLLAHPADVVLLHIGTNDLNEQQAAIDIVEEVGEILDEIERFDPHITVILAQIINRSNPDPGEDPYDYVQATSDFNQLLQTMANGRIAGGSKILVIDQENALIYPDDLFDLLHPNSTGYNKMAAEWLSTLDTFMPVCLVAAEITSDPVTEAVVGQLYTYQVTAMGNPKPVFDLLVAPDGMAIDEESGLITWTPTETGLVNVTVAASNSEGSDEQGFTIEVVTGYAPDITSSPPTTTYNQQLYSYNVVATGSPTPTYELVESPPTMMIDEATGSISWTPTATGQYSVTVRAINPMGMDEQSYLLEVIEVEMCPLDMVAYWKLDEAGTAVYTDVQGGHHAECAGQCPTPVSGQVDGGQLFNGSSTGLNVPAHETFNWAATDSFSIEFWMKGIAGQTCLGNRSEVAVGRIGSADGFHWWLGCAQGSGVARFHLVDNDGGDGLLLEGGPAINDGNWHHVVGVRDGSVNENHLYVDGVLVDSGVYTDTAGFVSATAAINIGWFNFAPYFRFRGTLDEVAIHNRVLSPTEVGERFNVSLAGQPYCTAPDTLPEIVSVPVTMTVIDQLYTYDVDATGQPLPTYALITSPADMSIDETTGLISWTPTATGLFSVTVEASNSAGTAEQPFTIEVIEAEMCPVDMSAYWKLDEVSSAVYTDAHGGHHGQCAGECPMPASGQVGSGQFFDGSSTGISVPAHETFNWSATDSFSIEFWMKGVADQSCAGARSEVAVGRDDAVSGGLQWWLGCDRATRQARFQLADTGGNGSGQVLRGGPQINDGQWHHIVGVRDGGTNESRLYVNGVLVASLVHEYTAGFGHATAPISIGWLNLSPFFHFRGTLDEVAIHNRSLSSAEVLARYSVSQNGQAYCVVEDTPAQIVSQPVTVAVMGQLYNYDVDAVGFPTPVYTLTAQPAGMSIDAITGIISWTPPVTGTFPVTVRASNGAGEDTQSFNINVGQKPTITSMPVTTVLVDTLYTYDVDATGFPAPTYAFVGQPPQGMTIDATTGVISWTPTSSGNFPATVRASNMAGDDTQSFTIEVRQLPAITSTPVTTVLVDTLYTYDVDATGFPAPTYAFVGQPPQGMTIDATTGVITWTPATPGAVNVTVQASNAAGQATQSFTIDVWQEPAITSTPVLTATASESYSYQVTAVGDPTPVYTLTTSPAGMSIHETTGLITWTPTSSGTFPVTVVASNAVGEGSQSFIIEVWQKPAISSTPIMTGSVGELYTYQVTAVGHPTPGYALTTNPAGMSINVMTGLISWTPASPGSFNVTVLASNGAGTDEQSFIITIEALPPTGYRLFLPLVIGTD